MKTKLVFFIALFTLSLVACKKDKFTTKPQVKVKSISPGTVNQGNIVSMQSSFTDEEGDIDSVYVVLKWWDGNTVTKLFDTLDYSFDELSVPAKTRDGDVFVKFIYGVSQPPYVTMPLSPVSSKDTSCSIGLVLIDKAKNRSEYAESDKIRLIKP